MTEENRRVFIVLDGSFYPNIRQKLNQAKLVHRALYKSTGRGDLAAGGPRLVNPYQSVPSPDILNGRDKDENGVAYSPADLSARLAKEVSDAVAGGDATGNGLLPYDNYDDHFMALNRIEHIMRLIDGNLTGMVAWCGATLTSESLYKHLRGLNQILIPKNGKAELAANGYARLHDANMTLSAFRHADGNVLSQIVQVLSSEQFEIFMGPAERIYFNAQDIWDNGADVLGRKNKPGTPVTKLLHLTPENLEKIQHIRFTAYDKLFMSLLLDDYPRLKQLQTDLLKKVSAYRQYAVDHYHLENFDHIYDYLRIAIGYEKQSSTDSYMDKLLRRIDVFIDDKFEILSKRYNLEPKKWA